MIRSLSEKRADVWRLIDAARAVAKDRAAIAADLAGSTGLSREGIELAFERHLELDPSEQEVDQLIASAGDAPHVTVILSANVFVAGLRAIAIAQAASRRVVVRPSRREPHFARALVAKVQASTRAIGLTLAADLDLASGGGVPGNEIHIYGRDATIAAIRARVGDRARVRGHGAGMGLAFVGIGAAIEAAADALASDVIAFDQRGCLSPRVVLVEGEERAARFADALHQSLARAGERVPRGAFHPEERADASRYLATMMFAGQVLAGASHAVGIGPIGAPLAIPPAGRHIHVAPLRSIDDAPGLIATLAPFIIAVGATDLGEGVRLAPAHARVSLLGEMQRPRLDGPVDRR
jgi:Acyl-CoA reductase (LuxC)